MFNDLLIYCLNLLYIWKKLYKVQVYLFQSKSSFIFVIFGLNDTTRF